MTTIDTRQMFYRRPFELSEWPTIVRDDPNGGDPIVIAELHSVSRPEELQEILNSFNRMFPSQEDKGEPF